MVDRLLRAGADARPDDPSTRALLMQDTARSAAVVARLAGAGADLSSPDVATWRRGTSTSGPRGERRLQRATGAATRAAGRRRPHSIRRRRLSTTGARTATTPVAASGSGTGAATKPMSTKLPTVMRLM